MVYFSNIQMQKLLESCGFERCGWIDRLDEGDPETVYCFEPKNNLCSHTMG